MHFSISAKKLYIKLRNLFAKFIKSFRDNLSRPYFLANSNAIGVFCAILPIVGQTYLCFLLWLVMRKFKATQFSLPISAAWTFLTIPIFMPFILFGYYKLGCGIISYNSMSFREFLHRAEKIIRTSTDWEYAIKNGLKFALDDIGIPLILGASICILTATLAAYFTTLLILRKIRAPKEKKATEN